MNELQRLMQQMRNQLNQFLASLKGEKKKDAERPDIKMCPVCARFNASNAHVCEYCDAVLRAKPDSDFDRFGQAKADPLNPVVVIYVICVFAHLIVIYLSTLVVDYELASNMWAPANKALWLFGANYNASVFGDGQFWRLATHMFLHGGLFHIFMNLGALGSLGPMVLEGFGVRRFWLIAFLSGIMGGLLSALTYYLGMQRLGVGFSGALFGFLGASYVWCKSNGNSFLADRLRKYMIWGNVICILLTMGGIFNVDNLAHLGGMFTGMGLAYFFESSSSARVSPKQERLILAAVVLFWLYGLVKCAMMVHTEYF